MKAIIKKKLEDLFWVSLCLFCILLVCAIIAGFWNYPAFSCTYILLIFLTTTVCFLGYLEVDFLGMALVPYWGLSTALYFITFATLHYLHYKGLITFEIQWLVLIATSIGASLITFVVCFAINRSKFP